MSGELERTAFYAAASAHNAEHDDAYWQLARLMYGWNLPEPTEDETQGV